MSPVPNTPDLPELGTQKPLRDPQSNQQLTAPVQNEKDWYGWYLSYKQHERPIISIHPDGGGIDIGGNPDHPGRLVLRDERIRATFVVDGGEGASNQLGDAVLSGFEAQGDGAFTGVHERIRLSGRDGTVTLKTKGLAGKETVRLDGNQGDLALGGAGVAGHAVVKDAGAQPAISLDGGKGTAFVKAAVSVAKAQADPGAALDVNGKAQANSLIVKQDAHAQTLDVSGQTQTTSLVVKQDAHTQTLDVSGQTQTSGLVVQHHAQADSLGVSQETRTKTLRVETTAVLENSQGITGTLLDVQGKTQTSQLEVSGRATAGSLSVSSLAAVTSLKVEQGLTAAGPVELGATTVKSLTINDIVTILRAAQIEVTGSMMVKSADGTKKTILDGGDIRLSNADCAEDFDVAEAVEPGTVMVLDDKGALRQSSAAYDKRVAGVISGASGYQPGLILDKQEAPRGCRLPVALMGKVFCKVDADQAPIEAGDLLTTSSTPGHAMKAADPLAAFGAVIGKALQPLTSGKGLVPVLVALQ